MAEKKLVKGQVYVVTAKTDTTVKSEDGLDLSVKAGSQATFVATTDKVELEGDCTCIQPVGFNKASSGTGTGGGGEVDPSNFVSKVEFAEFQESNEQALEAKQDTLATGEGLSIVDNTIYATYVEDARGYATDAAAAQAAAVSAQSAAVASASTAGEAATAAASSADAAAASAEEALSILGNTLQADKENTFTAAQSFHAPVTVGVPRVAAVRASKSVILWPADMRKGGAIADNDGRSVTIPADSTRTPAQFIALVEASELGLKLTTDGTTYYIYDFLSPDSQAGTIGNTRKLYVTGFGYSKQQTWSLSGGKDGVAEVGQPVMLNGNVYIGHGPEGVKARCYFDIYPSKLVQAGVLSDNNPNHPLAIELPEDPARTVDTMIAEINEQGDKLEVKAIKYAATRIYLESTVEGSAPNGVVFTRSGCFTDQWAAAGAAQTTTQGSVIKGLDEGVASEWELRQNGYPVASRQTNNVYEGVQVFNNAVSLNGAALFNGSVDGTGLTAFTRNLFMQPADAYASCSTQDDVLAADPMIAWRHAVYIHKTKRYTLSDGSVSKCLGNFGNTDRVLYIDFDYKGDETRQFEGVYCKAAFVNMRHAHNNYTFSGMKVKALYTYCASPLTTIGSMVKQVDSLEEIYIDLPECRNWATSLDWSGAFVGGTLKKAVFMTTGTCTSLKNLRGGEFLSDYSLLTSLKMGDVFNVTNADNAFQGFTKVPSSNFPGDWPSLSTGKDMFRRCSLLAADKADAILDSLPDWSTEETPADHTITFTGTAAATAWAAEGADLSHVEAAEAKGWTVER